MNSELQQDYSPEVIEKSKKNLVYVGIFSVVMLFAGFTSAYIVSMGDSFWLKFPLPSAFWVSTTIIIISSVFYQLAIRGAKKDDQKMLRLFMTLTLLAGIAFVYFQFRGYRQLIDNGAHAVNNHIIVTNGRYGDYYEIKMNGSFLEVDGNKFLLNGKELSEDQFEQLKGFCKQFLEVNRTSFPAINQYGKDFILYLRNQPLALLNGKLTTVDGKEVPYVDLMRLRDLAVNLYDHRGDFFAKGEIGKDFHIYYKGKELEYVNRELHFNGKKLSKYMQIKAMEAADTSTSYLYLITFLHLLHILVTLIYLAKMTIGSFSGRFSASNTLSLRLGAIFWHFLGLLWIYLLLFLLFIH